MSGHELWSRIHKILEEHAQHYSLIKNVFDNHLLKQDATITDIRPSVFYQILEDALKETHGWQGVHQGEIELLCKEHHATNEDPVAKERYLNNLSDKKFGEIKKERIIILTRDQEYKIFPKTPEERESSNKLLKDFWTSTGEAVQSYVVFQDNLSWLLGDDAKYVLHDCALHDGQLLLHYNKETETLLVGGPNSDRSRVIRTIFDGIEKKISIFRPMPQPLVDARSKVA